MAFEPNNGLSANDPIADKARLSRVLSVLFGYQMARQQTMMLDVARLSPQKVQDFLGHLRPEFSVLADYLSGITSAGAWEDIDTKALLAVPNLEIGPSAYKIVLFPPLESQAIDQLQEQLRRPQPMMLRHLFRHANGGFLGNLSIYGIHPQLDRSTRSPLNIAMGDIWRINYATCEDEFVLFASRNTCQTGQIGYFLGQDGKVVGRGNEQPQAPARAGNWDSLSLWLENQVALGF